MSPKNVSGVYAAVLTPRLANDELDVSSLRQLISFLMTRGIKSFALNGATGEFCLTTSAQLRTLISTVRDASGGRAEMICGIGAAGTKMTIDLAAVACEEGAKALLLPMPYFFPYKQPDLNAFCRAVAASTPLDVMLYNLPQFTSGLTKETVRTLISEVPNIIGIKDSSGSLDILRDLTHHQIDACRIVGNDSALAPALVEGVCDGVVSGVACALPELILEVYGQGHETAGAPFQSSTKLLAQFITQLDQFPTPWGLKWIVEARGVMQATFSQPVAQHRLEQAEAMAKWFAAWLPGALPSASSAV